MARRKYKEGSASRIGGRKHRRHKGSAGKKHPARARRTRNYCKICGGPHVKRHGLPSAKTIVAKGGNPRKVKIAMKRRHKSKHREQKKGFIGPLRQGHSRAHHTRKGRKLPKRNAKGRFVKS